MNGPCAAFWHTSSVPVNTGGKLEPDREGSYHGKRTASSASLFLLGSA